VSLGIICFAFNLLIAGIIVFSAIKSIPHLKRKISKYTEICATLKKYEKHSSRPAFINDMFLGSMAANSGRDRTFRFMFVWGAILFFLFTIILWDILNWVYYDQLGPSHPNWLTVVLVLFLSISPLKGSSETFLVNNIDISLPALKTYLPADASRLIQENQDYLINQSAQFSRWLWVGIALFLCFLCIRNIPVIPVLQ